MTELQPFCTLKSLIIVFHDSRVVYALAACASCIRGVSCAVMLLNSQQNLSVIFCLYLFLFGNVCWKR